MATALLYKQQQHSKLQGGSHQSIEDPAVGLLHFDLVEGLGLL